MRRINRSILDFLCLSGILTIESIRTGMVGNSLNEPEAAAVCRIWYMVQTGKLPTDIGALMLESTLADDELCQQITSAPSSDYPLGELLILEGKLTYRQLLTSLINSELKDCSIGSELVTRWNLTAELISSTVEKQRLLRNGSRAGWGPPYCLTQAA